MSAREEVLGRIRTALGPDRATLPVVRDYRLADLRAARDRDTGRRVELGA